jgi:tetratricopeptide (TPR) repeat protein
VVGDPLYRPFGRIPEELHADLEKQHNKLVEWSYLRLVNLNQANSKPIGTLVPLLENLEMTKQSAVLSEKLGDLYGAQGKPSSAVHAYQQALKLDPTPQQQLRLLLTLAEKLPPLNREPEAYEDYQKLVQAFPDFPDKITIYRHLLALARSLKLPADAEKYDAWLKSQP